MENSIGSKVIEILSYRQKNLTILYHWIILIYKVVRFISMLPMISITTKPIEFSILVKLNKGLQIVFGYLFLKT